LGTALLLSISKKKMKVKSKAFFLEMERSKAVASRKVKAKLFSFLEAKKAKLRAAFKINALILKAESKEMEEN
jgi:hypothetical protein